MVNAEQELQLEHDSILALVEEMYPALGEQIAHINALAQIMCPRPAEPEYEVVTHCGASPVAL